MYNSATDVNLFSAIFSINWQPVPSSQWHLQIYVHNLASLLQMIQFEYTTQLFPQQNVNSLQTQVNKLTTVAFRIV